MLTYQTDAEYAFQLVVYRTRACLCLAVGWFRLHIGRPDVNFLARAVTPLLSPPPRGSRHRPGSSTPMAKKEPLRHGITAPARVVAGFSKGAAEFLGIRKTGTQTALQPAMLSAPMATPLR